MSGRRTTRVALALAVSALVFALAGVGSASRAATPFKVAWILVGPHNDGGWSQAHVDGMLRPEDARQQGADDLQGEHRRRVAVRQTVASLVAQGYKMIFATSYGYVTPAFAAKYPNVLFEQATGTYVARTSRSTSGRPKTRSSSRAWRRAPPRRRARSASSSPIRSPR